MRLFFIAALVIAAAVAADVSEVTAGTGEIVNFELPAPKFDKKNSRMEWINVEHALGRTSDVFSVVSETQKTNDDGSQTWTFAYKVNGKAGDNDTLGFVFCDIGLLDDAQAAMKKSGETNAFPFEEAGVTQFAQAKVTVQ